MASISDPRVVWIRGRVLEGLGLGEDEFRQMLQVNAVNSSSTAQSPAPTLASSAAEILQGFLGPKGSLGAALFFHTEMENVEESEEYDEEYQESEPVEGLQPCEAGGASGVEGDLESPPTDGELASSTKPQEGNPPSAAGDSEVPGTAVEEKLDESSSVETASPVIPEMRVMTKTRKAVRTILSTKRRCRVTQGNLPDSVERVVYLVKNIRGEVSKPLASSDDVSMTLAVEYGCLAGDCLTSLSALVKEVFAPLLDHQLGLGVLAVSAVTGDKVISDPSTVPQDAPKVGDTLRNEFRSNLQKFESHVAHATQQVKGDVHLSVPNINIDDPEIGNAFEAVSLLEGAMEDWSRLIASVVETENVKRVKGKGPMAEIEFWRRRNASLSALYEQINMPKVRSTFLGYDIVTALWCKALSEAVCYR